MEISVGQLILTAPRDVFDFVSLFTGIATVIIAIVAIWYTKKSVQEQKTQWLYESYIKNEADVLLEAKKLFTPAMDAVGTSRVILFNGFLPESPGLEAPNWMLGGEKEIRGVVIDCHNDIREMYNFFVQNANIFIKHKLDDKLDHLNLYLNLLDSFPPTRFRELEQNGTAAFPPYMPKYVYSMIYLINKGSGVLYNYDYVNTLINDINAEMVENAKKILVKTANELEEVGKYLDKITVFEPNEGNCDPVIMKMRQKKRACRLEKYLDSVKEV